MKTRTLAVWPRALSVNLCAVLAIAGSAACTGRVPLRATQHPAAEARDPSSRDGASAGAADSSRELEDELLDADPIDAGDQEVLVARANEAAMDPKSGGPPSEALGRGAAPVEASAETYARATEKPSVKSPSGDLSCELTAITGHRSDARVRWAGWHGLSGGLRVSESTVTGFLRADGGGVVRGIHVGRLAVRAGERLILGRGIGSYASSGSGTVREGWAVSPSLSQWFGSTGAALDLGWAKWRCRTVVVSADGERWSRPQFVWGSAVRHTDWGVVGMTVGEPLGELRVEDGRSADPRPGVVLCHGSFRSAGFIGSCEIARLAGGRVFFAARTSERGWPKRARWSVLVFRAPYGSPGGVYGIEPNPQSDQGARVDFSSGLAGMRASVVLIGGRTWSPSRRRAYRRLSVGLENRGRSPVWWEVSAHGRSDRREIYPTGPVVHDVSSKSWPEVRLRAAVGVCEGKALAAARIEHMPRIGRVGPGTLLSLVMEVATRRVEARVQLSAHALSPGRRAFVSRPGVGPFESLAPLYGDGSDLSVRLRVAAWEGARFVVFYGSPWLEAARVYLGVEYHR